METIRLAVKVREDFGKQGSKRVRRRGAIPAIVYGHNMKPLSIEVELKELHHALHTKAGENALINLEVQGAKLKESTCLIKDIQHNPVTDSVTHVDFTVISLTEEITVKVPVVVKNAADIAGLKEGGVLDVIHHEIEVKCLPTAIPEKFEIDIKQMKIGDILHASELALPAGVRCELPADEPVIAIHAPREEEAAAPAEEAAVQPEVIEKGKKPAEEGEEGAAEAKPAAAKSDKPAAKPEK